MNGSRSVTQGELMSGGAPPTTANGVQPAARTNSDPAMKALAEDQRAENLLKTGALQIAILNSANFSSIATDEKGVIQVFNVGAELMLGYQASEVIDRITPADLSDPPELVSRAHALSAEFGRTIAPGFEALVFKASREIEDIYELTYVRKNGSRLPAVVSVTALRNGDGGIIGYLLIGTDNTARKQAEETLRWAETNFRLMVGSVTDCAIVMLDSDGIIVSWNAGDSGLDKATVLDDAHLATVGLPDAVANRTIGAVRKALDVTEALDRFNQHSRYKLKVRVGLDTGAGANRGKRKNMRTVDL